MLCYVMLCYVMLCYVMLCYVMLCYVMKYRRPLFQSLRRSFAKLFASNINTSFSEKKSVLFYLCFGPLGAMVGRGLRVAERSPGFNPSFRLHFISKILTWVQPTSRVGLA